MKRSVILACCLAAAYAPVFAQQEKQPPPPPPPPPKVEVVEPKPPVIIRDKDLDDFYKRNPEVAEIRLQSRVEIHFKDKNKKAETYDLSDEKDGNAFKAKYGDPPAPLAPPPPPPPPKKKREAV